MKEKLEIVWYIIRTMMLRQLAIATYIVLFFCIYTFPVKAFFFEILAKRPSVCFISAIAALIIAATSTIQHALARLNIENAVESGESVDSYFFIQNIHIVIFNVSIFYIVYSIWQVIYSIVYL